MQKVRVGVALGIGPDVLVPRFHADGALAQWDCRLNDPLGRLDSALESREAVAQAAPFFTQAEGRDDLEPSVLVHGARGRGGRGLFAIDS